uniref:G-protein coupled receptors family 1 profile domain-containing protein n=1 Tax=Globodera rostochiensis TaxID=31243 RepID=A0A914H7R8_GLORO
MPSADFDVPENLFYNDLQLQNGGKHSATLILSAVLLNCVGIPGFLMNLSVVYVTIKNRTLHGSANFLLALTSLFEMGHEAGHLLFLWLALSGQNFIPYGLCVRIMALSLFCIGGIFASMLCTGVDRILCVLQPNVHGRLNLGIYLTVHCLFCLALGSYILMSLWNCANLYPSYPVTGYLSDLIIGQCAPIYTYSSLVTNLATILLYILVGLSIWCKSTFSQFRLFRSLVVIIVANIGGYLYVSIMHGFVLPNMQLSNLNYWYINIFDGILLNISSACNAFVLFCLSKDYRAAYQKEFGCLSQMLCLGAHNPPRATVTWAVTVKPAATRTCPNVTA